LLIKEVWVFGKTHPIAGYPSCFNSSWSKFVHRVFKRTTGKISRIFAATARFSPIHFKQYSRRCYCNQFGRYIIFSNRPAWNFTGFGPQEMAGKHFTEVLNLKKELTGYDVAIPYQDIIERRYVLRGEDDILLKGHV